MASKQMGEMTRKELEQFVDARIDTRIKEADVGIFLKRTRSMDEVRASVRRNRIVLPEGAKSPLEMLREDREQ